MAAVTILDGKNVVAKTNPRPPGWIALPWGIVSATASASGAVVIFSSLQYTLSGRISELLAFAPTPSHTALIFGFFSVPCLVFSMLFAYKRLLFDGGKTWQIAHWSAILLFLAGVSIIAVDGKPLSFSDGGLLVAWNIACLSLAWMGTKISEQTFKGLNQTIGARTVLVPMMRSFVAVPILATVLVFSGLFHGTNFQGSLLIVTAIMFLSSYLAVKQLNAVRTSTASSIATIIWAPTVLANAALLPALAGTQIWLAFTNTALINWIDYAGGAAALLVSLLVPIAGGMVASKELQYRRARSIGRDHDKLPDDTESRLPVTNL